MESKRCPVPFHGNAIDLRIDTVLSAERLLVRLIGPWEGPRPLLPPGQARISLLTPGGLHFGQGPFAALSRDPLAAPVIRAAAALMQALVSRVESPRNDSSPRTAI